MNLYSCLKTLLLLSLPVSVWAGEALTSSQLVNAVLQANPKLEMAQATWQASQANVTRQSAWADPQFHYRIAPLTANSHQTDGQRLDLGQRFELSQHIPFPGKLQLRGQTAQFLADSKKQRIANLQLRLATQAKILFADWYFIHQAIAINQANQTLLKQLHRIALSRYRTGRSSRQDVLQAEMEQNMLKHQTIVLARQRKTLQAHINTLLNRPVTTALPLPRPLRDITSLPALPPLQLMARQSRPELLANQAVINAHQAQVKLVALDYYPDLTVSAGYNSLWNNRDKRFNVGLSINLPLDTHKRRAADFISLLPILWSDGAGADLMKRIAAPMVGGIASALVMVLLVLPAVYSYWKR